MAHFLCAYLILTRLFLKPAYAHLVQLQQQKKELLRAIREHAPALDASRAQKIQQLTVMQKEVLEGLPRLHIASDVMITQVQYEKIDLSDIEKKKMIQDIVVSLRQRIIHE